VSSFTDPLYVIGHSPEEIRPIEDASENNRTYVMAHAHSSEGVIRARENMKKVPSLQHSSTSNKGDSIMKSSKKPYY